MIVEINPNWGYIVPILVLSATVAYQHIQINRLTEEAAELWNQIGLLAVSISNKFTEFDTKLEGVKEAVALKKK